MGGISMSPLPADLNATIKPTMAMQPFLGINSILLDEKVTFSSIESNWFVIKLLKL